MKTKTFYLIRNTAGETLDVNGEFTDNIKDAIWFDTMKEAEDAIGEETDLNITLAELAELDTTEEDPCTHLVYSHLFYNSKVKETDKYFKVVIADRSFDVPHLTFVPACLSGGFYASNAYQAVLAAASSDYRWFTKNFFSPDASRTANGHVINPITGKKSNFVAYQDIATEVTFVAEEGTTIDINYL